ncbi:MAG TPA: SGNH/GDSL hydrolase family protein [Planctomycetota bacterium]|nr:SGNH/GDSL hydrolase family protein [Planctomycetota bacterium]
MRWAVFFFLLVATARADDFYLKDKDKVVFYGDSITDQRLYTAFVEAFVVTRCPERDVRFVHSGWGGDTVRGGGGGPIDRRLERDVLAHQPTVVTVMLGMNDASYRAFDEKVFGNYSDGYEHLVASLEKKLPGVRMTLIEPSPYDDVTRKPNFAGGYNDVLVKYGAFVRELAAKHKVDSADLNASVVRALEKANEKDAARAQKLIPDRVHPGPAGHLLMAAALLEAWKAPGLVSSVEIDGSRVVADGTTVAATGTLSWTQTDHCLPAPIDAKDPLVALALESSDVVATLDRERLVVKNLEAPRYLLKIDGKRVASFSREELAKGVDLALLPTPMLEQALEVAALLRKRSDVHNLRWRQVQIPLEGVHSEHLAKALAELDALDDDLRKEAREAAKPRPRTWQLVPLY